MQINSIQSYNNKYSDRVSFSALKPLHEMNLRCPVYTDFGHSVIKTLLNSGEAKKTPGLYQRLVLYWANAVDKIYELSMHPFRDIIQPEAVFEIREQITQNSTQPTLIVRVNSDDNQADDNSDAEIVNQAFNSLMQFKELIKKIEKNPELAENSDIQDEIIELIVRNKYPNEIAPVNSFNYDFINEIYKDIVSKNSKRLPEENFELIKNSIGRYFKDINEYNTYQNILNKSAIEAMTSYSNSVYEDDIKNYFNASPAASFVLMLIGEKSFMQICKMPFADFTKFCNEVYLMHTDLNDEFIESVIEKTNFKNSEKYKYLSEKLSEKKKMYNNVKNSGDIKNLNLIEKEINSISSVIKKYQRDEIKDYQLKSTLLRQIAYMPASDAEAVLKIVEKNSIKNQKVWNSVLLENVLNKLGVSFNKNFIKSLNIDNLQYIDKIALSTNELKNNLRQLLDLLSYNSDKMPKEIFNNLPQNKLTKKLFEDIGANYNRWVSYDKNSKIERTHGNKVFTFRQVDMNNVMYALFLGNYASCCMKVGGGSFSNTAPNYISNKFASAIEVLDGDKPIGNTICYLALANNKPVLILDNICVRSEYGTNESVIGNGFLDYAKKLCSEIGLSGIGVYTTSTRQKISLNPNPIVSDAEFQIIGSSGNDYIYIDDITTSELISPNKTYRKNLYEFAPGLEEPDGFDIVFLRQMTTTNHNNDIYDFFVCDAEEQ